MDYNKGNDFYEIISTINDVFQKSFTIVENENYILPKPEKMFIKDPWKINELQLIKQKLNDTKSKLDNYCLDDWHQHTSQRNKAKEVEWRVRKDFDPEFVTQAWCKFHEIISKYLLVPRENIAKNNNNFVSVHLCEAPGAFVTCLNNWLKTNEPDVNWNWMAMTLNPYYEGNSIDEMVDDDRFIVHTLKNWFFGSDDTGDLMVFENLKALEEKSKTLGIINLVTADGSINCMNNPGEQEDVVAGLQFCETIAAMHVLDDGGNFLIKIFTTFEHQSVCLIYLLSCSFKRIQFYKPVTSKEGNSEVYLICLGFKGKNFISSYLSIFCREYKQNSTKAMFDKNDIPESFIRQIINCSKKFKDYQCQTIESNIVAFSEFKKFGSNYKLKKLSKLVADKYMMDFPMDKVDEDFYIVGHEKLKRKKNYHFTVPWSKESLSERQKKSFIEPNLHLSMYSKKLESLKLVTDTFIYKPNYPFKDICIKIGKHYQREKSSKFCPVEIFKIYNLFFQVIDDKDNKNIILPMEKDVLEYENTIKVLCNESYKFARFQYTRTCNNMITLMIIKRILKNLQEEENLLFSGFLLLTHFNVGLIYLLSYTFDKVEFVTDDRIGCSIIFKSFKREKIILEKLEEIYNIENSSVSKGMTVYSVVPALELYDSGLNPIIAELNNNIIKYCVSQVSLFIDSKKKNIN